MRGRFSAGPHLVCAVGVADDIWDLDWMAKLAGQILAALLMAWGGVQLVALPIGGRTIGDSYLSLIATVVVVVVAINAVNFVDGLDGLAAGLVAIGGTAFMVYTYVLARGASPGDYSSLATVMTAVMVGASLGFLPHNVHPARIFMGDSGSMVLGLVFAAAAITVTGQIDTAVLGRREQIPAFLPILLPLAVVAVPLIDMALAFVRRLGRGQSPFKPDAHHLHHRLLRFGHSHRWAVAVLWLWTFVLAFGTVSMVFLRLRYAAALLVTGFLIAAVTTFSPAFRRLVWHLWRSVGVASEPTRTANAETRQGDGETSVDRPDPRIDTEAETPITQEASMHEDALVYRTAARWSSLALTIIAVVGIVLGVVIDGRRGAVSALAAVVVAAVFSLTTQIAAWKGARQGPMSFVAWVVGTWLLKFVLVLAAVISAQHQDWILKPLFGAVLLGGTVAALIIDIVAVVKARVPYVRPDSALHDNEVG